MKATEKLKIMKSMQIQFKLWMIMVSIPDDYDLTDDTPYYQDLHTVETVIL